MQPLVIILLSRPRTALIAATHLASIEYILTTGWVDSSRRTGIYGHYSGQAQRQHWSCAQ